MSARGSSLAEVLAAVAILGMTVVALAPLESSLLRARGAAEKRLRASSAVESAARQWRADALRASSVRVAADGGSFALRIGTSDVVWTADGARAGGGVALRLIRLEPGLVEMEIAPAASGRLAAARRVVTHLRNAPAPGGPSRGRSAGVAP